jgi:hypothetical protein
MILQENVMGLFRYSLWRVGAVDRFRTKSAQSDMEHTYFSFWSFMVLGIADRDEPFRCAVWPKR